MLKKILTFAAAVEVGTGLALMIDPERLVSLLLGNEFSGAGTAGRTISRCFGIALLALGVACWPSRRRADFNPSACRAMVVYNVLIALYLAYYGAFVAWGGMLLWPAVVLHTVVAILLAGGYRRMQGSDIPNGST
ncbi:MAG: hypothetical protein K8T25_22435 [Planctomycetia bacterium]|nr:hypothetical protein [Planctomycetia bacterium]